jgi:hypothetical protein
MRFEQIGKLPDQLAAIGGRDFRPRPAFESAARRFDGSIDIGSIGLGNRGDRLTGCRVEDVESLARFGVDPFAVDQQLVFTSEKGRSGRTQPCMSCRDIHGFLLSYDV